MPNKNITALFVFLLAIVFYLFTLSPSLAWGDGVRLQSEAISGESFILAEMPPGEFKPDPFPFSRVGVTAWDHPLYVVLGNTLVQTMPFVDSLWLVNLISAVFGAASVTLVFLLCYEYTASPFTSIYAALALAISHTFWWHASTPEVYSLFVFLLLLCIYFFEQFERTANYSVLTLSAFSLGLAMTDHVLAVLVFPALILYWLLSKKIQFLKLHDWKKLFTPALGFLGGFSLYIIQFIRLSQAFEISRIADSAVGSTFLNGLGAFSPVVLAGSLLTYLLFLVVQFGPHGIALGMLGIRSIFLSTDPNLRKVIALYAVYTLFGIFYRVTDQFAFFMTSHVFFALLIGIGLSHLFSTLKERRRFVLSLGLILTIVCTPALYRALPRLMNSNGLNDTFLRIPQIGTGLRNGLAYYIDPDKRGDFNAYNFGERTINGLAPGAVVIAEWYTDTDEYFILRYFHKIAGIRPDVTIYGWPTEDPFSFNSQLVLDVIDDSFAEHPIYLASLSERFYATSKLMEMYCIVPESNLYRLYPHGNNEQQCLEQDVITE